MLLVDLLELVVALGHVSGVLLVDLPDIRGVRIHDDLDGSHEAGAGSDGSLWVDRVGGCDFGWLAGRASDWCARHCAGGDATHDE